MNTKTKQRAKGTTDFHSKSHDPKERRATFQDLRGMSGPQMVLDGLDRINESFPREKHVSERVKGEQ